jgi:lipopolysaccharide/colanic/teichoic acid biosynthesis glycosyltransferase
VSRAGDRIRRAGDVVVSAAALVVCAPVLLFLAAAVLVAMGRPVLFVQRRSGRAGVPFRLIKFRSMTETRDGDGRLLPDAQRTTPLGRFLRRSRLDELPELWNVLRGQMSLIGPRPILPETIREMGEDGRKRGLVRPGLTGWAQICGNSSLNNDDKLTLDLWYIDHRSLRLDLLIVFKTVTLMLFGEAIDRDRIDAAWAERIGDGRADLRR